MIGIYGHVSAAVNEEAQDACMKERITAQAVQPRLKVSSKIDMFFSAFAEKHAGLLRAMTNATRVTPGVGKKKAAYSLVTHSGHHS